MKAVEVRGLWWRYQGRDGYVLRGVNLDVERGERLAIMGRSGAGKTTLVLAMNGVIPSRVPGEIRGDVRVLGTSTLSADAAELARKVGTVFEDPEIQFVMSTVEDEVVLGLEAMGLDREEVRERLEWALELVGLDRSFLARSPLQLSGGEKQRVAIAAAVARRPELLLLDEPTSDLDPASKEEVVAALRRLRDELDMTIVLVEHDPELVADFADRVAVLADGRVAAEGSVDEVLSRLDLKRLGVYPPQLYEISRRLGLPRLYRGPAPLACELIRRGFTLTPRRRERRTAGRVVLECRGIRHVYPGGVVALRGVSLALREGELASLVGPNGSGKTTLAKIMAGIVKPTDGAVYVDGTRLDELGRLEASSLVGYVYQNPDHQIFNQTVYDEVAFGLRLRGLSSDEVDQRVKEALRTFGLEGLSDEHPFFLSKGEKRRLALASIYALRPRVLIVDEPTTGQDMEFNHELFRTLRRLASSGHSVLVITHSIALAAEYSDRLIVMRGGRVIADGAPGEVLLGPATDEGRLIPPPVLRLCGAMGVDQDAALSVDEFISRLAPSLKAGAG